MGREGVRVRGEGLEEGEELGLEGVREGGVPVEGGGGEVGEAW